MKAGFQRWGLVTHLLNFTSLTSDAIFQDVYSLHNLLQNCKLYAVTYDSGTIAQLYDLSIKLAISFKSHTQERMLHVISQLLYSIVVNLVKCATQ